MSETDLQRIRKPRMNKCLKSYNLPRQEEKIGNVNRPNGSTKIKSKNKNKISIRAKFQKQMASLVYSTKISNADYA